MAPRPACRCVDRHKKGPSRSPSPFSILASLASQPLSEIWIIIIGADQVGQLLGLGADGSQRGRV